MLWIIILLAMILAVLLYGASAVKRAVRIVVIIWLAGALLVAVLSEFGREDPEVAGGLVVGLLCLLILGVIGTGLYRAVCRAEPSTRGPRRRNKNDPPPAVRVDSATPVPPSFLHEPDQAMAWLRERSSKERHVAPASPPSQSYQPAASDEEGMTNIGTVALDDEEVEEVVLLDGLKKRVHLAYTDSDGILTRRDVDIHTVTEGYGKIYLDGYCRLREGPRRFRLDRCQEIQDLETGEVFTPDELAQELGVSL